MDESTEGIYFQNKIEESPDTAAILSQFPESVLKVHKTFGNSIRGKD
jgi:hypothetical protein